MMKPANVITRVVGTLALPVIMYFLMMWLCLSNGKVYFGTWTMWKSIIADIGVSVTCAMGIGLQFKNGRFDFSGGAIMLLASIIAGNVAKRNGNNVYILVVMCMVVCIACSLLVALVYVYGRMPIVIVTIGMALLFESITCLVYNGGGISLVGNSKLKIFSSYPMVLLPLLATIAVYAFYSKYTTSGKQSALLANNQQSAVNIGINEKKNVILSYLYSGIIFGFATMIYCSTGILKGSFSSLSTVGALFSNILPVFIGLALFALCGDTIGTIVGAIALCIMSFGLEAALSAEFGAALTMALTGVFVLVFNVIAVQGKNFKRIGTYFTRRFGAVE